MNNKITFVLIISLSFMFFANAQIIVSKKLLASDGDEDDNLGNSISLYSDFLAVGAYWDDNSNGANAGSVYFFKKQNDKWIYQQKLLAFDGQIEDRFGRSLSVYNNFIAIGAVWNDQISSDAGAVYIFKLQDSSWFMHTKLIASDGSADDYFGRELNLYQDKLIVGAIGYPNGEFLGAAYIFENVNGIWEEVTKISPKDLNQYDYFGYSVSIIDSISVIGAPQKSVIGSFSGSAYIYKYKNNTWLSDTTLIGSNVSENDAYGSATAIKKNFIFIGSPGNIYTNKQGSVYIFEKVNDKWIEKDILQASDGFRGNAFGSSISIKRDSLLIGANSWVSFFDPGSAYLFVKNKDNSWEEIEKFIPDDQQDFKQFGSSVSMNDEKIFFGAPGDNSNGNSAGAVYFYPDDPVSVNDNDLHTEKQSNSLNIYPNPFNSQTSISFYNAETGNIKLSVYNVLGEKLSTLINDYLYPGSHSYSFNAPSFTSGLYLIILEIEEEIITRKILVVK